MPEWIVELGCGYVYTYFNVMALWYGTWRTSMRQP